MRLSEHDKNHILTAILKKDPCSSIYLYGSRVDDSLAGGDIDLLVVSESLDFSDKISLLVEIKDLIGEQKIDLSIKTAKEAQSDPFFRSILSTAIKLNLGTESG